MDPSLLHILTRLTLQAIENLYRFELSKSDVSFQPTRKEFTGDITLVIFPLLRYSKKSPEQTGHDIGEYIKNHVEEVAFYTVIKGFLNFAMSDAYWLSCLEEICDNQAFGLASPKQKRVVVEFSSPNTNKPLHLGHVRNNVLGYSLSEILSAAGYDVIRACLVNDRGIHISKSMIAWEKFGDGETPESSGLKGDHLVGKYYVLFEKEYRKQIAELVASGLSDEDARKTAPLIMDAQVMLQRWEAKEPAVLDLWKMMNAWVYAGFEQTYHRLGIHFDKFYYESDTYLLGKDIIAVGLNKGVFYRRDDGSVWIDLREQGLDEKLVLRADGTSVYITQDLGTAELKFRDFHMDESVFVVGNEQDYHFKVLFLILDKLGEPWVKKQFHMSYGMVDLPSGKMKSREGTVVDADELMDEMLVTSRAKTEELGKAGEFSEAEKENLYRQLGMGALKFFLLRVDPRKRLLFDPLESIDFQGTTGPFVQYSYARIRSILRKTAMVRPWKGVDHRLNDDERNVIRQLFAFRETVQEAASEMRPDIVASYLYELARLYNRFYHEHQVLVADDERLQQFRLNLCLQTSLILRRGMSFLGIEVPEQM